MIRRPESGKDEKSGPDWVSIGDSGAGRRCFEPPEKIARLRSLRGLLMRRNVFLKVLCSGLHWGEAFMRASLAPVARAPIAPPELKEQPESPSMPSNGAQKRRGDNSYWDRCMVYSWGKSHLISAAVEPVPICKSKSTLLESSSLMQRGLKTQQQPLGSKLVPGADGGQSIGTTPLLRVP